MTFDQIVVLIGETDEFPSIKKHFDDMKKKEDERYDYEDWKDFFQFESDITKNDIRNIIEKYNLSCEFIAKNHFLHLYNKDESVYLEYFPNSEEYEFFAYDKNDIRNKISNMSETQLS